MDAKSGVVLRRSGRTIRPQMSAAERDQSLKTISETKKKATKENLPYIKYRGKIRYHTDMIDCAMICENLLETAKKRRDIMVVGFDMEWSFSFQTGPERTSVIQISPDLDVCHLLHVSKFKSLPKSLSEFLAHPNVRLAGNNVKCDARKLARDFVGFDSEKLVENCIDLGVLANSFLPFTKRWSLAALLEYTLKMRINKDKKVRMSQWHVMPLSTAQQRYAAIDVYASLLLYQKLQEQKSKITSKATM